MLLLLLCSLSFAGPRADREAAEARLSAVEAQALELQIENARLQVSLAALSQQNADLDRRLDSDEATQMLMQAMLADLDADLDALQRALTAPTGKKIKVDPQILQLQKDLATLRAELDTLRKATAAPGPRAVATVSQADEDAASKLLSTATAAISASDYALAKTVMQDLLARYPDARAARGAEKLGRELAIIGLKVTDPVVERWFTAPAKLADKPMTILVFWEAWCPHCKRELPALNARLPSLEARGVQVIALTKITKSSTEDTVKTFIADNKLGFAVGKEDGEASTLYAVSGIPAAAVIVGGEVVWRGHPARLDDALVDKLLAEGKRR